MPTRQDSDESARVRAYRARLALPRIISIDEATAYWLEDSSGRLISEESPASAAPLAAVLTEVDAGASFDDLILACRLADGQRYAIGRGGGLYDAALSAAGLPPARLGSAGRKASA